MTKNKTLNLDIYTWWWNMGIKTKDFQGTYGDWFKKHKISITEKTTMLIFTGSFGSMRFTIKMSKDYIESFNIIIKLCLTFLGDKAMLHDGYHREYKINWR